MFLMKDMQFKSKRDGRERSVKIEVRGKRVGRDREMSSNMTTERSEQGKWMNLCGEKSRAFFMVGHKRGRKDGLRKS